MILDYHSSGFLSIGESRSGDIALSPRQFGPVSGGQARKTFPRDVRSREDEGVTE